MLTMTMDHYDQSDVCFSFITYNFNQVMQLKILFYFKAWDKALNILNVCETYKTNYFFN